MTNRILDRSNYSKITLDNFELISAYFIDIYYNHLYCEGKKLRENNNNISNITDGYKHALNAFMKGIENPTLYKRTLTGIHNYFDMHGFTSMTFTEFIDRITKDFIPDDYYNSVSKQQRIAILKVVISQANKIFIEKLVRKFLGLIIDNHKEQDNIKVLQNEFVDILMLERENMYYKFISVQTNKKNDNSVLDYKLIEEMKNEILKSCKEKFLLKKKIVSMNKELNEKNSKIMDLEDELTYMQNNISNLETKLKEFIVKEDTKY